MARERAVTLAPDARRPPAVAVVELEDAAASRLADCLPTYPDAVLTSIDALSRHPALGGATVVVFGPAFANPAGLTEIQALTRSRPDIGAILVARRVMTKLLKAALRAGVRDVLVEPIDEHELAHAVEHVGDALAVAPVGATRATEPGKLVTVFSTKGGVGTSVIAASLASTLARRASGPVALVDIDLQFGDAAVLCNVAPRHTILDAVTAAHSGDGDVVQRLLLSHEPSGMLILPSPVDPALGDQISAADVTAVIEILRERCSYVVVDTPCSFNDAVLSAVETSDSVIFVGGDDVPTVKNLKVGLHALRMLNVADQRVSVVLNRVEGNTRLRASEVERAINFPVTATIPADSAVTAAVNRGIPFVDDAPKSKAAKALAGLADHVANQTARPLVGAEAGRTD
jgi:pilus assembly protein CpaE